MAEEFNIRDVAELISNVQHIKEGVDRIEKQVSGINGRLQETEKDLGVVKRNCEAHEQERKEHREEHKKLDDRITNNTRLNGIGTAIGCALAAFIGSQR